MYLLCSKKRILHQPNLFFFKPHLGGRNGVGYRPFGSKRSKTPLKLTWRGPGGPKMMPSTLRCNVTGYLEVYSSIPQGNRRRPSRYPVAVPLEILRYLFGSVFGVFWASLSQKANMPPHFFPQYEGLKTNVLAEDPFKLFCTGWFC